MYSSCISLYLLRRFYTVASIFTEMSAAVDKAELEEAGGAIVHGGVVEAELGGEVGVRYGARDVDGVQRLHQMIGHLTHDPRGAAGFIHPHHGQAPLPQRGFDVLQQLPILLDQYYAPIPILPRRDPRG